VIGEISHAFNSRVSSPLNQKTQRIRYNFAKPWTKMVQFYRDTQNKYYTTEYICAHTSVHTVIVHSDSHISYQVHNNLLSRLMGCRHVRIKLACNKNRGQGYAQCSCQSICSTWSVYCESHDICAIVPKTPPSCRY